MEFNKKVHKAFMNENIRLEEYIPHRKKGYKDCKSNPLITNFSINIPLIYKVWIRRGVILGMYPSRTEAVRIAIREFLKKELPLIKELWEKEQESTLSEYAQMLSNSDKYQLIKNLLECNRDLMQEVAEWLDDD